jgi:glycosyltransferase involved in cell wall biosynthesis
LGSREVSNDTDFTIGFAGGLYASTAWNALISTLEKSDWKIDSRTVKIILLGHSFRLKASSRASIEFLGFRNNEETQAILSACDITYLPVPFEPNLKQVAQLSFPTKLSTYLTTGRPVFVHAPSYASVSRYFQKGPFGVLCDSLDPKAVHSGLARLASDQVNYDEMCRNVQQLAAKEFNQNVFYRQFAEFMGVDASIMMSDATNTIL